MNLHASFGVLSEVIEQCESGGRSVRDVEATVEGGTLAAELDVAVGLCAGGDPALDPEAATVTDDGRLCVEFAAPGSWLPDGAAGDADAEAAAKAVRIEDGRPVVTVALTIGPEGSGTADAAAADRGPAGGADTAEGTADDGVDREADGPTGPAAVRDESVPPYEDTAYLERLYEACDTFEEMSRRIEMEVSAETVRRYMIEAGVHDPTPYDTADGATAAGGEASAGEDPATTLPDEQLVTDGVGLPADLRVEDVVDAVVGSVTVHEVHCRLGVSHERTRTLLEELNLLDLVMGRLATASEEEVTEELVAARLRECAAEG